MLTLQVKGAAFEAAAAHWAKAAIDERLRQTYNDAVAALTLCATAQSSNTGFFVGKRVLPERQKQTRNATLHVHQALFSRDCVPALPLPVPWQKLVKGGKQPLPKQL